MTWRGNFFASVKRCYSSEILPSSAGWQASLPQFLGYWLKTQASKVRDKGFHRSWHRQHLELLVHVASPRPSSPTGVTWSDLGRCCSRSVFVVQLKTSGLRKLQSSIIKNGQENLSRGASEGDILVITLDSKRTSPLLQWEISFLFFFFSFLIFIYLAAPALSCCTLDLLAVARGI